jgi:hypothetical protein
VVLIDEKTEGRKSRATVPLNTLLLKIVRLLLGVKLLLSHKGGVTDICCIYSGTF